MASAFVVRVMRPTTRLPVILAAVAAIVVVLVGGSILLTSGPAPTASAGASAATPGSSDAPSGAPTESPSPTVTPIPSSSAFFPGGLLIADRGNGRLLVIDDAGTIVWRFPTVAGALPAGQKFTADDAFIDPNGKTIVANDENHQVIDRIDIATGKIVWQFGQYGVAGPGKTQLHTPDDAYPLANGDIIVADIRNCRILEIAPDKTIARQWGKTGVCTHKAGVTFGEPNGDTPLPDGGLLITEITGSRVVRLDAAGNVVFDIHVPVLYPSDAQLDENGNVVVADFSSPGQVVAVDPTGKLVWRYGPTSGPGMLNHPSLATPLPGGLVVINDDGRDRMVVIDPATGLIVWQYGHTGTASTKDGYLSDPDGHQPLPVGFFPIPSP